MENGEERMENIKEKIEESVEIEKKVRNAK